MPHNRLTPKDRRQINLSVPKERRGFGRDRRKTCPECGSQILAQRLDTATGTVLTLACTRCPWTKSSRQTNADVLMAKLTWELPIEKRHHTFHLGFPFELMEALKLKEGDKLVLAPLTLPVGSLPMKWALTVKKKGQK